MTAESTFDAVGVGDPKRWMRHVRAHDRAEVDDFDDRLLLRGAADGDRRSFERLLLRHRERIESICRRFVPDDMVFDVCQEVALRIWVSARSFRGEGAVAGWIGTIAHNKAVEEAIRTSSYRRRVVLTPVEEEVAAPVEASGLSLVADRDLLVRVMASIRDPQDRYVFWLVYVDGYDIARVAAHLIMSPETVKSRLARAKKKLRWLYAEDRHS